MDIPHYRTSATNNQAHNNKNEISLELNKMSLKPLKRFLEITDHITERLTAEIFS